MESFTRPGVHTIPLTLAFVTAWLGLNAMLDGQPSELQAERDVAAQVAQVGAEHVALLRQRHPSAQKPARRAHRSTQLANAEAAQ